MDTAPLTGTTAPAPAVPGWLDELPPPPEPPVAGLALARRLRDAGLAWEPAEGHRFVVPDRDMDDRVFLLSSMVVEVRRGVGGQTIAFNGTTEWALDQVLTAEALWLPSETDLRQALGERFLALRRTGRGWAVEVDTGGRAEVMTHPDVVGALGHALLRILDG